MTDLRTAAQQALEALEKQRSYFLDRREEAPDHVYAAIRALRAALEQPEQEPVAWLYPEGLEALQKGKCWTAYGTKQGDDCSIPVYTHPPRREWRGLTLEEVQDSYNADYQAQTRAIEAALKERNA
jgi:hypothetical protein